MERGLGVTLLQFASRRRPPRRADSLHSVSSSPLASGAFAAALAFVLAGGTDVTVLTVTPQSAIAEPCGNPNC
jgi:hypothetical protein